MISARTLRVCVIVTICWSASLTKRTHASTLPESYTVKFLYPLLPPANLTNPRVDQNNKSTVLGQTVGSGFTPSDSHALLWRSDGTAIDLHPTDLTGFSYSDAFATNGTQQVGRGGGPATYNAQTQVPEDHALLWNGTADSAVDLHPSGMIFSVAEGIGQGQIVGDAGGATGLHAILWSGPNHTVTDLNPTNLQGFTATSAVATDGTRQVGSGDITIAGIESQHALMWSGSGTTTVDLHPTLLPQILNSFATSNAGMQQVGYGTDATRSDHALFWTGTAESAVDLTPPGTDGARALDTNGSQQVGYAAIPVNNVDTIHALLWNGTAESVVDLNTYLPSGMASRAFSIDEAGDVFGVAGNQIVEWVPTPEPSAVSLVLFLLSTCLLYRGRAGRSGSPSRVNTDH